MKNLFGTALFLVVLGQCAAVFGQSTPPFSTVQTRKTPLLIEREVERFGLTRSWYNQISLNQKRNTVKHVLYQDGTIFIVSNDARLHAIDAETGGTLWVAELGDPGTICMAPAANSRMVAALGGVNLQVFDRKTGMKLWENDVSGIPGAGCALSERHIFIPLASGRILAWPLEEAKKDQEILPQPDVPVPAPPKDEHDQVIAEIHAKLDEIRESIRGPQPAAVEEPLRLLPPTFIPMECQSYGNALIQPIVAEETALDEYLVWPTLSGDVYFGCIGESVKNIFALLYRVRIAPQSFMLDANQSVSVDWVAPRTIVSQPVYSPRQVLKKDAGKEAETTPADSAAKKASVRSRFASPQFDDEEDIFSSGPEEEEDIFSGDSEETLPPTPPNGQTPPTQPVPAQTIPGQDTESDLPLESDEDVIPSMILVGNVAGFVVAINDQTGEVFWKYVTENPVIQRVVIIKDHVYACTQLGGMYCLDARNGQENWFATGIVQFIAESEGCVYGLNSRKEIAILERETGRVITTFPVMAFDFFLDNRETDRIYIGMKTGLIQCLHEVNQFQPLKHRENRIDLAAKIQAELAAAEQQQIPKRQPAETTGPAPVSVPDFGGGFDSSDEESPFNSGDDDSSTPTDEDDDSDSIFGDE